MFAKRRKKIFPPGTFIPMPARVCAIIQLCLAFTLILWKLAQPFSGEFFTIKSHLLLFEDVIGRSSAVSPSTEQQERLARNRDRFEQVSPKIREEIKTGYDDSRASLQRSFFEKLKQGWIQLVIKTHPFEQAWLFFSIIISVMLLKKVEGATQAIWLLPLLTALYAADNRWHGNPKQIAEEVALFPLESTLMNEYLKVPLSKDILEQRKQLEYGWKLYLVHEWTHETLTEDILSMDQQAEEGEFAFNLKRLQLYLKDKQKRQGVLQEPLWILAIYLFWNIFFAYTGWKHNKNVPMSMPASYYP